MPKSSLYSGPLECQTQNYNTDIIYLFTRLLYESRSLILIVRTTISITPTEKMVFTHSVMIYDLMLPEVNKGGLSEKP